MSKLSSSHEKSVKKHASELLCIIVRLIMSSKCYESAQMMRLFIQASFVETTLKRIAMQCYNAVLTAIEGCSNVIMLH